MNYIFIEVSRCLSLGVRVPPVSTTRPFHVCHGWSCRQQGTNRQPERSARTCPGFMKPQSVADARNQLQAVGFLVPSTGARGVSVGCRDVTGVGGSARGWKRSACGGVDGQNPAPRDGGVDDDEAPDVVKAPGMVSCPMFDVVNCLVPVCDRCLKVSHFA